MSETSPAGNSAIDLVRLLAQGADSKTIQHHVFSLNVEQTAATDPELARMLRACAIPRRFDTRVIGVLRKMPDDYETNERLLKGLLNFSFVIARRDGDYVYHDNTRDLLLEEWLDSDNKSDEFDELNQRLADYYRNQYEVVQKDEEKLAEVAKIMIAASPARYIQLKAIIEKRILSPLLEALYHESLRSIKAGYDFFSHYFGIYEQIGRLNLCELLLNATRDTLERLPPNRGQEPWLKWLRYWDARLELDRGNYAEAEHLLTALRPEVADDTKLHSWLLGSLGQALQNQNKLREALEVYKAELALSIDTRIDQYNLPIGYSHVASLYWLIRELQQAAALYREAIQISQDETSARLDTQVTMRLDLSSILYESGNWAEAFDVALEALQLARSQLYDDRAVQQSVANQFMRLFARRDPRLIDTLFAESDALQVDMDDLQQALEPLKLYIDLLQDSGQLLRAEAELMVLFERAKDYAENLFGLELLFTEASLRWDQGQLDEALDLYTKILQRAREGRATDWAHARALSNRGMLNSEARAAWGEATIDLAEASQQWTDIGHDKFAALMQMKLAIAARRQGNIAESQNLLDKVRDAFSGTNSGDLADHCQAQGDLYRDQALYGQAKEQYEHAAAINLSFDRYEIAAQNFGDLAALAAAQGQWTEAEHCTQEANALWKKLAAVEYYTATLEEQRANKINSQGIQHFCQAENRKENLRAAQERFRKAMDLVPDNFWYHLNLAWTYAQLEEWAAAAETLESALEKAPKWLRSRVLYAQVADYRLKEGDHLLSSGNVIDKGRSYAESLTRLKGRAPADRLAEGWLALGDGFLKLGQSDDSQAAYQAGLECALSADTGIPTLYHTRLANVHGRLGTTYLDQSNADSAYKHFVEALWLYHESGKADPGATLGNLCRSLIQNITHYWRLDTEWEALSARSGMDEKALNDLSVARTSLARYLDELYQLAEQTKGDNHFIPVVTPIVVEFADNLVPKVDDKQDGGQFLFKDIPAMRERIENDMGVRVTGLRARGNPGLAPGGYIIQLDEIPIASGIAQVDMGYCPVSLENLQSFGVDTEGSIQGSHPGTGEIGCWMPQEQWSQIMDHGLELWTDTRYIIFHIETIIRRNLTNFLNMQQVETILDEWAKNEPSSSLIKVAIPDQDSRVSFARLLRMLVREWVPITNANEILNAIHDDAFSPGKLADTVRVVRLGLKKQLPGNKPGAQYLELPPEIEKTLISWRKSENDKTYFAASPPEAHQLLASIREWLRPLPANIALVTRSSEVRPFLRRLIESEFPDLVVLSREEQFSQDEISNVPEATDESTKTGANSNAI